MENLNLRDNLHCIIWDLYKDVYGVRPRHTDFSSLSIEELEKMVVELDFAAQEAAKREVKEQCEAIAEFEKKVAELIEMGAGDRKTAIRWLRQAEDDYMLNDDNYFEHHYGLPYGFLQKEES